MLHLMKQRSPFVCSFPFFPLRKSTNQSFSCCSPFLHAQQMNPEDQQQLYVLPEAMKAKVRARVSGWAS
jgi:hypothetical protein